MPSGTVLAPVRQTVKPVTPPGRGATAAGDARYSEARNTGSWFTNGGWCSATKGATLAIHHMKLFSRPGKPRNQQFPYLNLPNVLCAIRIEITTIKSFKYRICPATVPHYGIFRICTRIIERFEHVRYKCLLVSRCFCWEKDIRKRACYYFSARKRCVSPRMYISSSRPVLTAKYLGYRHVRKPG